MFSTKANWTWYHGLGWKIFIFQVCMLSRISFSWPTFSRMSLWIMVFRQSSCLSDLQTYRYGFDTAIVYYPVDRINNWNYFIYILVCNYPNIQNGHLETGDNVRYRTGQQAIIECDDGFEIRNGNGKIICKEDGSWEPLGQKELPQCKGKVHRNKNI